ncbi:AraC family transcriptional regulator [Scleromatobacter humisilvae]|uniref:AraC family transcriptional regulator n=1 Tax=Scleromatobacter humisilvae TaxID=2897159 RepID=A0A9X1YGB7_9BURK|nr:AraC family transcriptional regulator [Scleromatobacter humisilvae]MCK9685523.1 AraC family transcriptional regulator [Scleromatobacter humisilvae]
MAFPLSELQSLIARHARPGAPETALAGVRVLVSGMPTKTAHGVSEPGVGIVAQGAKQTVVGDRVFEYGEGDFVISSVDLPISSRVTHATAALPYLACRMALNPAAIASLLLEAPGVDELVSVPCGMGVHKASADLLEAAVRLLRLLDSPRDAPVLRPLIEREILWRLLCGPQGGRVRQIGLADSRLAQVSHAIRHIRQHFAESLSVDGLAGLATMSVSSFHRHFRAVTAMTPIQFQKQIRLQEARSRLLADAGDVAAVGFAVGYDSASQFSREYSRMFGAPPGRDVARLRQVTPLERAAA